MMSRLYIFNIKKKYFYKKYIASNLSELKTILFLHTHIFIYKKRNLVFKVLFF